MNVKVTITLTDDDHTRENEDLSFWDVGKYLGY